MKNFPIKREQNRTCSSYAEREENHAKSVMKNEKLKMKKSSMRGCGHNKLCSYIG